jgi:hypothetical protein
MLDSLTPVSESEILALSYLYPSCPVEYLEFIRERGVGALIDNGEHFVFESHLLSAEQEYFQDREIYSRGAKGDVLIFGWESGGTAFGFDVGDNWQLVEVDEYRTVTKLGLSFKRFVEGMLVCYPQIPMSYSAGRWEDGLKMKYEV